MLSVIPKNDIESYKKYKDYRKYYDRYYLCKLQNMRCGLMNDKPDKYPVFVKPKINLSGGNKGCKKVKNESEFNRLNNEELFWSEYLDGKEGSFDLVVYNGEVLYKIHYEIYHRENSYLEDYKKVSNEGEFIYRDFVREHFRNYSGFLNIQYRNDKIIELSLRLDSGGRFITQGNNKKLIEELNDYYKKPRRKEFSEVDNIYVFKISVLSPFIFIPPKVVLNRIIDVNYNYYVDLGERKSSILNIYVNEYENGRLLQKKLELFYYLYNILLLYLFYYIYMNHPRKRYILLFLVIYLRYLVIEDKLIEKLN